MINACHGADLHKLHETRSKSKSDLDEFHNRLSISAIIATLIQTPPAGCSPAVLESTKSCHHWDRHHQLT